MPIFDQGYQHWDGPLSGHGTRWWTVTRHGVRSLSKTWIVRIILLLAWIPALALVTVLTMWGLLEQQVDSVITIVQRLFPPDVVAQPKDFRAAVWTIAYSYFFKAELFFSLFLVLFVGPNLVSRDLRFNAFPLYFSRPLRRIDYFLGKLGVIGYFLVLTVVGPAVGAYLLGVAFSLDLGVVRDTWRLLVGGILYGLVITFSAGTLMLALSSLSRRSIYVGLAWAGFVFLSSMLSGVLIGVRYDGERQAAYRTGMTAWLADHPPPKGVRMSGVFPRFEPGIRFVYGNQPKLDPPLSKEEEIVHAWHRQYLTAQQEIYAEQESRRAAMAATDWRPLVSYSANLDRMSDWLLDTDSAWVLFGRTFQQPRNMVGAMRPKPAGLPAPPPPSTNERSLADQRVWQFPWYWSAATLGGLWLLSAFILSRRVKSLDRLK